MKKCRIKQGVVEKSKEMQLFDRICEQEGKREMEICNRICDQGGKKKCRSVIGAVKGAVAGTPRKNLRNEREREMQFFDVICEKG